MVIGFFHAVKFCTTEETLVKGVVNVKKKPSPVDTNKLFLGGRYVFIHDVIHNPFFGREKIRMPTSGKNTGVELSDLRYTVLESFGMIERIDIYAGMRNIMIGL